MCLGKQNYNLEQDLLRYFKNTNTCKGQRVSKGKKLPNECTSAAYIAESKTGFKKVSSQKPGGRRKLKLRDSSRINVKRCGFNIHTIRANMARIPNNPLSTKLNNKVLDSASHPSALPQQQQLFHYSNLQSALHKTKEKPKGNGTEQIRSLLYLLESARSKSGKLRAITPSNQSSKLYTKKKTEIGQRKGSSSRGRIGQSRSRMARVRPERTQEDNYDTIEKIELSRSIKCNLKKSVKDTPYRTIAESVKGRNIVTKTVEVDTKPKFIVGGFMKAEDTKNKWRKYIDENAENCSTTTNKSSLLIGKVPYNTEEKEDNDSSSDEKLTVIEYECENNYDLICKSLQGQFNHC